MVEINKDFTADKRKNVALYRMANASVWFFVHCVVRELQLPCSSLNMLEIKAQSSHLMCVIVKVPKYKTCVAKVCILIAVDV